MHAVPGKRLPINFDPSCRERNWGLWEGRTIEETKNLSDGSKQADDKYAMDYAPAGGAMSHVLLNLSGLGLRVEG
jgi:broad specificity phosphatase PhoE